jgi:hypothetical protein
VDGGTPQCEHLPARWSHLDMTGYPGLPVTTMRMTVTALMPCLVAVETYPRVVNRYLVSFSL